jgi:hypothetical protein
MRKRHAMLVAAFALFSTNAIAAEFPGYIIDQNCAGDASMKGNEACARKCIRKGSPAVLLAPDSKVYKLEEQAKVVEHAGHKVKVTGTLNGDTIKVEKIELDAGCTPGPTGCQ